MRGYKNLFIWLAASSRRLAARYDYAPQAASCQPQAMSKKKDLNANL
jgi:hypothetical protein